MVNPTSGICFGAADSELIGLKWLLRLRWIAILAQLGVSGFSVLFLRLDLPWLVLLLCIGLTAASNLALTKYFPKIQHATVAWTAAVILTDILILTTILFFSDGAHNPFTMIYLLHITLAVMLLPGWISWLAIALCGICFGLLFLSPYEVAIKREHGSCSDMLLHLQGMVAGMLAVGAGLTYFVGRMNRELVAQRKALEEARQISERHRHFASLATLAAGVAHELATPLATIAVASQELERNALANKSQGFCVEDARLIQREVNRCKGLLQKLGQQSREDSAGERPRFCVREIPIFLEGYLPSAIFERCEIQMPMRQDEEIRLPLSRLLQALGILITNAIEASPPDSRVQVIISKRSGEIVFRVRDVGHGMSDDVVRRLGEPFFTLKETGQGLGLGLFLVRTFVEEHSGSFSVESEPGVGTLVEISFPTSD